MELNSTIKDRLNSLLADPTVAGKQDEALLVQLVDEYPYFKAAHLLLARATQNKEVIEKAVLYSNGQVCYNILNKEIATERPTPNAQRSTEEVAVEAVERPTPNAQLPTEEVAIEAFEHTTHNAQHTTEETDDQETFEEISEFNSAEFVQDPSITPDTPTHLNTQDALPNTNEDAIEIEYLHWELEDKVVAAAPEIETVIPDEPEHAPLSKYDDDKLPYTFLWWLAKTRAEHQQIFQPYAAPKKAASGALQQQYVEHIFHLQTGLPDSNGVLETGSANAAIHKEDELINAFLQSDPQIKPPPVDKLDNENKARKSAEDHNDVVSETLATIYIEQMLYRKAIDTYEKLSLKFPEKSRYFADLIKSLEKKI